MRVLRPSSFKGFTLSSSERGSISSFRMSGCRQVKLYGGKVDKSYTASQTSLPSDLDNNVLKLDIWPCDVKFAETYFSDSPGCRVKTCKAGYELSASAQACVRLTCKSGYQLSDDKISCVDTDECQGQTPCRATETCKNNDGGYTCSLSKCLLDDAEATYGPNVVAGGCQSVIAISDEPCELGCKPGFQVVGNTTVECKLSANKNQTVLTSKLDGVSIRCNEFAGTCVGGTLIDQPKRTQHHHCGKCDQDFYLVGKTCVPCDAVESVVKCLSCNGPGGKGCLFGYCKDGYHSFKSREGCQLTQCPANSRGASVLQGCLCNAGYYGKIEPTRTSPFSTMCKAFGGTCANVHFIQAADGIRDNHCGECNAGFVLDGTVCNKVSTTTTLEDIMTVPATTLNKVSTTTTTTLEDTTTVTVDTTTGLQQGPRGSRWC